MRIHAGQWQFITVPQLKFLMRPHQDPSVRVWACGMLHSIGQRQRLAVKRVNSNGKTVSVPLAPSDILAELNAFDVLGRMDKQSVRRSLSELERHGAARRSGTHRNNVRLFFYAKPLKSRSIPLETDLGIKPDYQISTSDSKDASYEVNQIYTIRKSLVKSFLRSIRETLAGRTDLVVQPDYQKLVDEELDEVMKVVSSAYQKLLLAVCSAPHYKECSISSIKSKQAGSPDAPLPACPTPDESRIEELKAGLFPLFPGLLKQDFLLKINTKLKGVPVAGYNARVAARWKKAQFQSGLLLNLAEEEALCYEGWFRVLHARELEQIETIKAGATDPGESAEWRESCRSWLDRKRREWPELFQILEPPAVSDTPQSPQAVPERAARARKAEDIQ